MDILNGTDVKGQILFCTMQPGDQDVFQQASQYVQDGGGSGVIFAQYTTDLSFTALDVCQGIACILVDLDIGKKIASYMDDARYPQKLSFLCNGGLSSVKVACEPPSDRRRELTCFVLFCFVSSSPMAKIEPARTVTGKETLAPKVAMFSSRGPSPDYPAIIKVCASR